VNYIVILIQYYIHISRNTETFNITKLQTFIKIYLIYLAIYVKNITALNCHEKL